MKIVNNINQNRNTILNSVKNNEINDFKSVLNNEIDKNNKLQFSKHANQRLINRQIDLSNEQMTRVEEGISLAKEKGIKETLVLVDNVALVVNIKSNVVVTAINNNSKQIFSNIDGAVIV